MEGEWEADVAVPNVNPAAAGSLRRHIKKRALKNKALSVSFNEKDLKDYVTGFHKRKKKRRKIAQRQTKRRIVKLLQRKLERETAMYGGALPAGESEKTDSGAEEDGGDLEQDDLERTQSVSGTKMYENSELTITVTTSEFSRGEDTDLSEGHPRVAPEPSAAVRKSGGLPPKKKPLKKVASQRSRKKKLKKSANQRKKGVRRGVGDRLGRTDLGESYLL
ncbi:unnamed protein product [Spirodela intermedia]|uniref:Uncharacterized protein n=1 Tax=Spirodela intermedia TaxID=51605 RepID=A0A7I8JJR0_SPIIN|nr:unnamed protein product [Spirodela intermedia]CAA6670310.1 unnamed protein product [Spirodela intermedia]